jgi:hypothetical protein
VPSKNNRPGCGAETLWDAAVAAKEFTTDINTTKMAEMRTGQLLSLHIPQTTRHFADFHATFKLSISARDP